MPLSQIRTSISLVALLGSILLLGEWLGGPVPPRVEPASKPPHSQSEPADSEHESLSACPTRLSLLAISNLPPLAYLEQDLGIDLAGHVQPCAGAGDSTSDGSNDPSGIQEDFEIEFGRYDRYHGGVAGRDQASSDSRQDPTQFDWSKSSQQNPSSSDAVGARQGGSAQNGSTQPPSATSSVRDRMGLRLQIPARGPSLENYVKPPASTGGSKSNSIQFPPERQPPSNLESGTEPSRTRQLAEQIRRHLPQPSLSNSPPSESLDIPSGHDNGRTDNERADDLDVEDENPLREQESESYSKQPSGERPVKDSPSEAPDAERSAPPEEDPEDGATRQGRQLYDDDWYRPIQLSNTMQARGQRISQCLDFYYQRPFNTKEDSPWSMMHTMLAWGQDSRIFAGSVGGRLVSTVAWLCSNQVCDSLQLLYTNKQGEIRAKEGPALQGHGAQFLAMLAQTRVPARQELRVGRTTYTVVDLIRAEQSLCRPRSELTFRLIGMSHYLDSDATWKDSRGSLWDIQGLMREEMAQPINGVTCGGTHRLMGLSYAIRRRLAQGKSLDGQYARAVSFTQNYQRLAFALQNRDGTFSSDFFKSKGSWGDIDRKVKTTGHTLEWMIFSLPHDQLQDPRLLAAVDRLTAMMMQNRYYDWEKGPISHATRALSLYLERIYNVAPGHRDIDHLANVPQHVMTRSNEPVTPEMAPAKNTMYGRGPSGRRFRN